MFRNFLKCDTVYNPGQIREVVKMVKPYFTTAKTNKKYKVYNIPCSFDIETSSFYNYGEKVATMYEWTLGIYGAVVIGRTWEEFLNVVHTIIDDLGVSLNKRLLIYVHNLSYEFQFIRKLFDWEKVFAIDARKPIYAVTDSGIEFRCSYLLSGYSLAKLADNLHTFKIKKMVGDLDYNKIRHSKTPLTFDEMGYCVNDVKIVMAYICEQIEQNDNSISNIPLTKTGYVRQYCRNSCFYESGIAHKKSLKRLRYQEIIRGLTLTPDEYKQLKRAFQGGFTHANPFYSGKVMHNVTSFDFTSSYPTVMIAEKFPMSSGEKIKINTKEEFERNIKFYCCLFDVEFINLKSCLWYESYISQSRCWGVETSIINNGRVVSARHLCTTLTEQDYNIIKKFYTWDKMRIANFRRYKKGYLPTDFIKSILKLYGDKTKLKDVQGAEVEYLQSKEMLNSCYGMAVTDIVRPEHNYVGEWLPEELPDFNKAIEDYNKSKSRFLFYPWGVWVTAYARRNLFTGICEFGSDYIYSDTDSVKVLHAERHKSYIERYNKVIKTQLEKAIEYHQIPKECIAPRTIEGKEKCLGVWDFDGNYSDFKTLGAKRYMVRYSNDFRNSSKKRGAFNLTVSGLNKQVCVPYLLEKYGENGIFKAFNADLYIPQEFTGKNTHTYIDEERNGIITDYLGCSAEYHELSSVHLEQADYSLSLSSEYVNYILSVGEIDT